MACTGLIIQSATTIQTRENEGVKFSCAAQIERTISRLQNNNSEIVCGETSIYMDEQ